MMINLQSVLRVISVKLGLTTNVLAHECDTFAIYSSRKIKKCVDCGKKFELYDLEIKHQR